MHVENLIIELTRRCNAACDHCLRGAARNKDIKKETLEKVLEDIESIDSIVFTGGEPSLNYQGILDFIEICKTNNITVTSFYIATNGVKYDEGFILAIAKLHLLCGYDSDLPSYVEISRSAFHDQFQNEDEIDKLRCLTAFSEREYLDNNPEYLINQGRAAENAIGRRKNYPDPLILENDSLLRGECYVDVNGNVIEGCDWSYKSQQSHKIGNIHKSKLTDMISREEI